MSFTSVAALHTLHSGDCSLDFMMCVCVWCAYDYISSEPGDVLVVGLIRG